MIQIRPVSDLRNKFPEIETLVNSGNPVYLTKNGYGAMVVLSLEEYASLTDNIEMKLDEADRQAAGTDERLSHESVFKNARGFSSLFNMALSISSTNRCAASSFFKTFVM